MVSLLSFPPGGAATCLGMSRQSGRRATGEHRARLSISLASVDLIKLD